MPGQEILVFIDLETFWLIIQLVLKGSAAIHTISNLPFHTKTMLAKMCPWKFSWCITATCPCNDMPLQWLKGKVRNIILYQDYLSLLPICKPGLLIVPSPYLRILVSYWSPRGRVFHIVRAECSSHPVRGWKVVLVLLRLFSLKHGWIFRDTF